MTGTIQGSVIDNARPGWVRDLLGSVRETLSARHLIVQLATRDIKIRYKEAVMGFAWAVFNPILIVLSGVIVRIAMTQATGGTVSREALLNLGVKGVAWGYFAGALSAGTNCLTGHSYLLSKVYFPRAVLPISANLGQAFDSTVASVALLAFLPWMGARLTPGLVWVPVLVGLLLLLTLGLSLFLSCANVMFRDVKHIVQVLITFGIFFTPVFYEPTMLGARARDLVMLNPLAPILEGLRLAFSTGHNLLEPLIVPNAQGIAVTVWDPGNLWYSVAWSFGALLVGAIVFRRTEPRFAELV